MRSTFHFVRYNLKSLFTSPRLYITLLLLFSIIQICLGGAKSYLTEHGQAFQAAELFIFAQSSHVMQMLFILGLLLLLGDAPFLREGISFHLIRSDRFHWLMGQFLSCLAISAVYLLAVEFLFLLLFPGHVSFRNEWSRPVMLAAQLKSARAIGIDLAISFSMNVIRFGSPCAMFALSFAYSLLLYLFFSLLLIVCNLRLRTGVGALAVMAFWCLKLAADSGNQVPLLRRLSPCTLACLTSQALTPANILYTIVFLCAVCFALGLLAVRLSRGADLLRWDAL